jgi:site-specific recombinase XerD
MDGRLRFTAFIAQRRVPLNPYLTKMNKSVKIGASMSAKTSGNGRPASTEKKRKFKHLSVDEVRRLFRVIPAKKIRDRLLFDLIYHYGLRRTEACLLQVEDFNPRKNTIVVHRLKGSDSHPYPLFPSTVRLLGQYLAEYREPEHRTSTRSLFPSRQRAGRPISASQVAHLFREYAKAAKIPADRQNVHSLRHSIAMHMGESEIDGVDMQDWMAHVSWASTRIYMHVSERRRLKTMKKMLASGEIA